MNKTITNPYVATCIGGPQHGHVVAAENQFFEVLIPHKVSVYDLQEPVSPAPPAYDIGRYDYNPYGRTWDWAPPRTRKVKFPIHPNAWKVLSVFAVLQWAEDKSLAMRALGEFQSAIRFTWYADGVRAAARRLCK